MSKRKRRHTQQKSKGNSTPKGPTLQAPSRLYALGGILRKFHSILWKTVVAASVVLGAITGAGYFLPRAGLELGPLADSSDLLTGEVTVTNTGATLLTDVSVDIGLCEIIGTFVGGHAHDIQGRCDKESGEAETLIAIGAFQRHELRPGESYTIPIRDLIFGGRADHLSFAHITVVVYYRPWFIPFWTQKEDFVLIGQQMSPTRYTWLLQPHR